MMEGRERCSQEALDDNDILEETSLSESLIRILRNENGKLKCQCRHATKGGLSKGHRREESNTEKEKMEKWRAAGAALRKALMESSQADSCPHHDNDAMNAMLGESKNLNAQDNVPQKDYRKLIQEHAQKWQDSQKDGEEQKITPGLLSVRERIKEITGHINNKCHRRTPSKGSKQSFRLSRSSRNPSQDMASSESEDDVDLGRHKFVPKCRRTSSASSSPRYQTGKKDDEEDVSVPQRMAQSAEATVSGDGENHDTSETETDMIARKLQELVGRRQDIYDSDPPMEVGRPYLRVSHVATACNMKAESLLNLADIESSMHSDEDGTLGESEGDVFTPIRAGQRAALNLPGPAETAAKVQQLASALKASALNENDGGLSPYQYSDEDLDNLDVDQNSEEEAKPVKLGSKDLKSLSKQQSSSSGSVVSEPDVDADDEFECDCTVCQHKKTRPEDFQDYDNIEHQPEELLQYSSHVDGEEAFSISLDQIAPLDLLMMREGRREVLELMFQNVIRQMLSVYPDLLSDHAPPPAATSVIQTLPTVRIQVSKSDEEKMCPVCLCQFQDREEAHQLPCHHLFHSLCIQAWLSKSGTCPVCRHVLNS